MAGLKTPGDTKNPLVAGKIAAGAVGVIPVRPDGGRDRDRTCDPFHVKEVLSR